MEHNHKTELERARAFMPGDDKILKLSELYKMFSDGTRMKILYSLLAGELCVCAISELVGMSQSATSHQLGKLKESKLVSNRREGKTVYYFLADSHVESVIAQGFEHISEEE